MIFETSQDIIDMSPLKDLYNRGLRKWGIKLSGGADSALVAYMLVKIIQDNGWDDVELHAITAVMERKPYNEIFAKRIIEKIKELTGFEFSGHYTTSARITDGTTYAADQEELVQSLLRNNTINVRFAGITANASPTEAPELWTDSMASGAPSDSYYRNKGATKKPIIEGISSVPLINIDKKGVAELYDQLGITDTLFPVTRSCEEITTDFSKHCGECWMCLERKWGFGRLI